MLVECIDMPDEPLMVRFTFKVLAALWVAIATCNDPVEEKTLWRKYFYYYDRLELFR